jgi:3-hydroxybutyryl-CoA dehydrogenase
MDFEHVLVVGAGQMGGGIAQVVAGSGRRVSLYDAAPGAVEHGLETMRGSLGKLAEKGGPNPDEVLNRVEPVDDFVPADLMVEAVIETQPSRKTSSAARTRRSRPRPSSPRTRRRSRSRRSPQRPVARPRDRHALLQPGADDVARRGRRGQETSDETAAAITELARELGKTPAVATTSRASSRTGSDAVHQRGRVGAPRRRRRAEAIDTIAKLGFAHPMGPLALADLIGLDTCVAIMEVIRDGLGEDRFEPCPLLASTSRRADSAEVGPRLLQLLVVDFDLSPEQKEIQTLAREFAQAEIEPHAAEWDREHRFPKEVFGKLAELGLMGVCVPGRVRRRRSGLPVLHPRLEELSRGDAGVGVTVGVHTSAATLPILTFGTDEQRSRFVPPLAAAS